VAPPSASRGPGAGSATRRSLLAAGLVALGGCGFRPLYAERGGESDARLAAVDVPPIPDRIGQLLALNLRDGFNPTSAAVPKLYTLTVQLTTTRRDIGIRTDATATRTQFDVLAVFVLRRNRDSKVLLAATASTTNGFDIIDNNYATVVAERSSQDTAVRQLGAEIQTRVVLALRQEKP